MSKEPEPSATDPVVVAPAGTAEKGALCDASNYLDGIRYVNNHLRVHGFGSIDLAGACSFPTADTAAGTAVAATANAADAGASGRAKAELVNCMYRLVMAHQQSVEYRN